MPLGLAPKVCAGTGSTLLQSLGRTNFQNDLLQSESVQQLTRVMKCVYKVVCIGSKKSSWETPEDIINL